MKREHYTGEVSRVALCAIAVIVILAVFAITSFGQETRRPSGRLIPVSETATPTPSPTPTQTPTLTPTPDPCAECIEPGTFWCEMYPEICYACWDECGNPQATPTPTRTPTRTPTVTPPPTPTPNGPACELSLPRGGTVVLVAHYAHESKTPGVRYSFQTEPVTVAPGSTVRPCPCEGFPVGFKWFLAEGGTPLRSCGDTSAVYALIFSHGFEGGSTQGWSATVPTPTPTMVKAEPATYLSPSALSRVERILFSKMKKRRFPNA